VQVTRVVISTIELAALVIAVYLGYRWYLEPAANHEPTFALSTLVVAITEWFRRHLPNSIEPAQLAEFIKTGKTLRARKDENPLPIQSRNEWVAEIEKYFKRRKRPDYVARLNDFSGMVFYGNDSEKSRFENSIDGRLRRLHQFMSENARNEN
jgi:hypothetical protein